jgi:hypothetical protein
MALYGFIHIFRATGHITALTPDQAGQSELIQTDQHMRALAHPNAHAQKDRHITHNASFTHNQSKAQN